MAKTVQKQRKNNVGGITGKGFVPGKSGNPGGRPKGSTSFKALLERVGMEESQEKDGKTKDEAIARKVYAMAEEGDKWAIQFTVERKEGKSVQPTADVSDNWQKFLDGVFEAE